VDTSPKTKRGPPGTRLGAPKKKGQRSFFLPETFLLIAHLLQVLAVPCAIGLLPPIAAPAVPEGGRVTDLVRVAAACGVMFNAAFPPTVGEVVGGRRFAAQKPIFVHQTFSPSLYPSPCTLAVSVFPNPLPRAQAPDCGPPDPSKRVSGS
jgi:hypothetical protein